MTINRRSFLTAAAGLGSLAIFRPVTANGQALPAIHDLPLTLSDRRVTMDVALNGQGPFTVVLDTGGQMSLLDKAFADRLRLPVIGTRKAQRVGRNVKSRNVRRVDELIFGGRLRQADAVFLETDDVRFHDGAVGSLAAGFLTSFDSELDLERRLLRLYPSGGPDRPDWQASDRAIEAAKLEGWSPHLFVDAQIGDARFRTLVDTGAPRGLLISPNISARLGSHSGNWAPAFKKGNKLFRAYRATQSLTVGPLRIDNPVVIEDEFVDDIGRQAVIGLEYLRRLNLATDVKRNRIYLKANANPAIPAKYNMSGLWVDRQGSDLLAGAVGKGSPAELAGIKVGEQLGGFSFSDMIDALNADQDSTVPLLVGKGSSKRSVNLKLVDYL